LTGSGPRTTGACSSAPAVHRCSAAERRGSARAGPWGRAAARVRICSSGARRWRPRASRPARAGIRRCAGK